MDKIYDLDIYNESDKNGAYGGAAGRKDGIIIDGEKWLIKYPKNLSQMEGSNASYSTAPLSEYLGSHIYKIIGFNAVLADKKPLLLPFELSIFRSDFVLSNA